MSNESIAEEVEKLRNEWFSRGSVGAKILGLAARRLRSDGAFFNACEADPETREPLKDRLDDLHDFEA